MAFHNAIALLLLSCTVWSVRAHTVPILTPGAPQPSYSIWDQPGGDMILYPEQLESGKSGITKVDEKWPKGVVVYSWDDAWGKIKKKDWVDYAKNQVRKAMDAITTSTCIRFQEAKGDEEFKIIIKPNYEGKCTANVGRANFGKGKKSSDMNISDGDNCIGNPGDLTHEFIHAIGFWHEQQRSDRDKYITVNWKNMKGDQKKNYGIQNDTSTYDTPYDYKSIMHYPTNSGSIKGTKAFDPNPKYFDGTYVGQTTYITKYDAQKINNMYKGICPDT